MYIGLGLPLSDNSVTFETDFAGIPESLRSIDGVELDLEFRYVTDTGLKELLNQTGVQGDTSSSAFVNNAYDQLANTQNFDTKWWIDNFTYTQEL